MTTVTANYRHPAIGDIQGNETDGVIQFLGVKYGVLEHWFDNAKLPSYDGSGLNAVKHGPQAISDPVGLDVEHQIIQKALPKPEHPGFSGTECLNMNISIPRDSTSLDRLPILVFIHGGGFFTGANWWPQLDNKRIVRLAAQNEQPIIAVTINYRLGMAGFLTSEELRSGGFQSNNGHHDQRLALRWLKKYAAGFGGDPDKITVVGESIGGLSALRTLTPDENLASRVVVFAGAPPLMNPPPIETAEVPYGKIVEALKLEGRSPEERIAAIASSTPQDLQAAIGPSFMFGPLVDGKLIEYEPTFDAILNGKAPWRNSSCEAIMVGYAPFDASVLGVMGLFQRKEGIKTSFIRHVRGSIRDALAADKLLNLYGIGDSTSDDEALERIIQFASDIGYRATARVLAKTFPTDAFLLQFSEPNPWEGPFRGRTTHVLDVAFLFQNYNEHLDEPQRATAIRMALDVVSFAHGQTPWDSFQKTGIVSVYQDGSRRLLNGRDASTPAYDGLLELGEMVGLDTLANLVVSFMWAPIS